MAWTDPAGLRAQVQRLWDRGLLLAAVAGEPLEFPRRLQLKTPTSRELSDDFDRVREWIAGLRDQACVRIEDRHVRHRVLGENAVPASAWLDSLDDAVRLLRKQRDLDRFEALLAQTREAEPALLPWVRRQPLKALALAPQWPQLLQVVCWMRDNPRPGIYLRQVSIPGIDSKFIERHRTALVPLLDLVLPADAVDNEARGVGGFERRYGFRGKPVTLRFRLLDASLSPLSGSDRDIALTAADFHALDGFANFRGNVRRVFITENEINFLAFPTLRHSLVLFGAGYGFEALGDIPWLARCRIYYWGDIDTHGFAILDQLRQKYPGVQSLLMDEATLLAHRAHWGSEDTPGARDLRHLTPQEEQLYRDLLSDRFGDRLRLEQERVNYRFLLSRLVDIEKQLPREE